MQGQGKKLFNGVIYIPCSVILIQVTICILCDVPISRNNLYAVRALRLSLQAKPQEIHY